MWCKRQDYNSNSKYSGFSTFKSTATITYFIAEDYTRKGLGSECLKKLEEDAVKMGIKNIIAEVSSENKQSIDFHKKHGFVVAGELKDIGEKFEHSFGVVYMQKRLGDM
ncbi:MAG: GNAT family N-acetyltransferase [Romboutsia timonensis]|uniref:GNAT family N-acetyltransferase n=1 Tax=Romboutsia timonensis TaxID=1776391 RepID=UPI002A76602A|nr:GNAT family N-acetyltransferase [Romboutsia timonensis]MDY2881113.1 GNAT family N-acetyltransferase [Romboutsia timonensis]